MGLHPWARVGFGRAARAYERARPAYPAEAVAWLAERLDLRPGRTVVDLGAGTGKLSGLLVPTGARVVAVEPVDEMRRLLERIAGVEVLAGTAEAIPLPDASTDAVSVAEAFHWFNGDEALGEIHRVLRPACALALVWNRLDGTDPVSAAFQEVIERYRGHPPVAGSSRGREAFDRTTLFTPLELRTFANAQELDADTLADRAASESSIAILPEERRREVRGVVRALAWTKTKVVLRYVTEVYISRRRP